MAKKDNSKEITKVRPELSVPKFMRDETETGLDTLQDFIVPPFVKVVQKQAGDELLKQYAAGDVILSPANALISEMPRDDRGRPLEGASSTFLFVPILFYPEWITWNPIELKGQEPAIRYRTTDPSDPVVAKARDAKLRTEPHPADGSGLLKIRHCEHLNFLVVLHDHPLGEEPCIMSFSRGEWRAGSRFASLIKMRHAPLFGCIFQSSVSLRHGQKGDWYGIDVSNPTADGISSWVTEDRYDVYKSLHTEFNEAYKDSRLRAQYDTVVPEDEAATPGSDEF